MINEQVLGAIFALTYIVQEINTLLNQDSNILFIAPTGWGKTTLLIDLIKNSDKTWVYLAPLRALANEFYIRCSKRIQNCVLISNSKEVHELNSNSIEVKLLVITPELLNSELLNKFDINTNYVFDEIHLFYYWGESFRPRLIECYEDIMGRGLSSLSLSATMSENLIYKWKEDSKRNTENSFIINLKNHTLKKDPRVTTYIPNFYQYQLLQDLVYTPTEFSKLIFFKYRQQVHRFKEILETQGFCVVSCVGGETQPLAGELAIKPRPDFILATTAISHGVNLPKISIIYLSYQVKNYDFWIQMIGRGGRQGEDFRVFTRDRYRITAIAWLLSILYIVKLKLWSKIYPYELRRYFNSQNTL